MWLVGSKPVRYKCYNSNIFFAWFFAQMTSCFVHYDVGGWQPYVSDELCGWYQLRKCKYPFLLSGLRAQPSDVFYFLWVEQERGVSFKNVKMKRGKQEMIQPMRFALWLLVLRCFSQYFGRNRRNPSLRIQPPYIAHWRWKVTTQEINHGRWLYQGPRSGFSSGGANAIALAWANYGGPGACSPGKIWNWSLLKWLEMDLKLPKVKLIFNSYKTTSNKLAFTFDQI